MARWVGEAGASATGGLRSLTLPARPIQSMTRSIAEELVEGAPGLSGGVGLLGTNREVELLTEIGDGHVGDVLRGLAEAMIVGAGTVKTAVQAAMQVATALWADVTEADRIGDAGAAVMASTHGQAHSY